MGDRVTLTFRAHTRNAALARTVAAAMAARADLPLDQLEDVRLAVDEAVSQLILGAPELTDVVCDFVVEGPRLRVRVSAPSRSGQVPDRDTFSWTVLRALVDEVTATTVGGVVTVDLRIVRQAAVAP